MDIYHIWSDLKPSVRDTEFTTSATQHLDGLKHNETLVTYRITRRKLGLGPNDIGEFHLMLEFANLTQLDAAFTKVATREEPLESFHQSVNALVTNVRFALYRDHHDSFRRTGEEKF